MRFALLGHPVRHSLSPAIHQAANRALGMPHTYSALDIPTEASLRRIVQEIRRGAYAGANVTMPYKLAVLDMVDELAPSAAQASAVNVIVRDPGGRLIAHNTDADALVAEIAAMGPEIKLSRAVIIGSGGAGLAAIIAAKKLGFKVIGVTSRSWTGSESTFQSSAAAKARELGALTSPWPSAVDAAESSRASQVLRMQWRELAEHADSVIQATSAGMVGGSAGSDVSDIVPWSSLPRHAVAYDVVYRPLVTTFVKAALDHGLRAQSGLGMLVRQAALSFALWTGVTPPHDALQSAAEQALAAFQ